MLRSYCLRIITNPKIIRNESVITPNGYMLDFADDDCKILHSHINSPLVNLGRAKKVDHNMLSITKLHIKYKYQQYLYKTAFKSEVSTPLALQNVAKIVTGFLNTPPSVIGWTKQSVPPLTCFQWVIECNSACPPFHFFHRDFPKVFIKQL